MDIFPFYVLICPQLTTCSPVGTASDETDITNKTLHRAETRLKQSAVPIRCSRMLGQIDALQKINKAISENYLFDNENAVQLDKALQKNGSSFRENIISKYNLTDLEFESVAAGCFWYSFLPESDFRNEIEKISKNRFNKRF